MRTKEDYKILAKIQQICEKYEQEGWTSWENELYIADIEEFIDKSKIKGISLKRIKNMIKEYYENLGRLVGEPVENDKDSLLLKDIIKEVKNIKVPSKYKVIEKLKDDE